MADISSNKSDRKKGETGSRKTGGSSSVLRKFGTGLSVQRTEDIAYRIAVDNVQDSQEYQKLKEVCQNPFKPDENYQWLVEFIKRRASKFWQYLQYRESGKRDKDLIRAASILEYSRLLAGLVKNHPEFEGRFTGELARQNPDEFQGRNPCTPAEFVEKLTRLNDKDYLGTAPAAMSARPEAERLDPLPAQKVSDRMPKIMSGKVFEDFCAGLESYIEKNLPQFKGFAFDSKCSLLTHYDWINIADEFRKKHAVRKETAITEVLKGLSESNRDQKVEMVIKYLRMYKI
ncbi:MAG: hypothetical protein PHE84_05470 [bacterium]|nr:hypothetical protein [bacterium]